MKTKHRRGASGLTLVDVLVVVCILFLLAALIPCSGSGAKRKAKRIQCVSGARIGTDYQINAADSRNFPTGVSAPKSFRLLFP
jgi:Tfp pilus assembly protein PilE